MTKLKIVVALSGLTLLSAGSCDVTSTPQSQPSSAAPKASEDVECADYIVPEVPPNLGNKRYIALKACVEDIYSPYTVIIHASDKNTGETVDTDSQPVMGGLWSYVLGYDTGHQVTYRFELKPGRSGSQNGWILARDGKANIKKAKIAGSWKASIDLDTAR